MIKSISLLLVTYCLCTIFSFQAIAQPRWKADSIPLFKFLQKNYDSTVVCSFESGWWDDPNYYIVCKYQEASNTSHVRDAVNFFTYKASYRSISGRKFPDTVNRWLMKKMDTFYKTVPDTNCYFSPVRINTRIGTSKEVWNVLCALHIWNINKDSYCNCGIMDGRTITYYLITKDTIKEYSFYEPHEFEKKCPGDSNRQIVIKAEDFFIDIFKG